MAKKNKLTQSAPFRHTGLDYFGLLYVKSQNRDGKKVWICLFICVAMRAVHLEIVDDLTAEEFFLALRRFIARWGNPSKSSQTTQLSLSYQNPQLMMHGRKSSKTHLCNHTSPIKESSGHLSLNYHHGWEDFTKD